MAAPQATSSRAVLNACKPYAPPSEGTYSVDRQPLLSLSQTSSSAFGTPSPTSLNPQSSPIPVTPNLNDSPSNSHPTTPEMFQQLASYFPASSLLCSVTPRHSLPGPPSDIPHISSSHHLCITPSGDGTPTMNLSSTSEKHILHVRLPHVIQPEMVTISVNKGDKLKIVADAWQLERDCTYRCNLPYFFS